MKLAFAFIAAVALAVVAVVPSHAGNCYTGCYQPYYAKQYAAPLVQQIYFVGAPIAQQAIVEAERRADPDWQAFQAWKAGQANAQQQSAMLPPGTLAQQAPADAAEPPLQSVTSCSRCHSGAEPKGGIVIDGKASLTPAQVKSIKAKLLAQEMPPPKSPEGAEFGAGEAGAVMAESVDLLGEPTAEVPAVPAGEMP